MSTPPDNDTPTCLYLLERTFSVIGITFRENSITDLSKVLLYLYMIYSFKKQMFQASNTDLFNPLVPKAHNSERQNLLFPFQIKPVNVNSKLNWRIFIFASSAIIWVNIRCVQRSSEYNSVISDCFVCEHCTCETECGQHTRSRGYLLCFLLF